MPPVRENHGNYLTLKEEQVYDFIRRNPGSKREDVQKYIGLGKTQTNIILTKLRDQAYIIKIGNGPATAYKIARKGFKWKILFFTTQVLVTLYG